ADAAEIDRQLEMARDAQAPRHRPRGLDLARVALPVRDGERVELEAVGAGDGRGRVGVEAAAQKHYRSHQTPRVVAPQMYLWICSWRRTGRRSSRIHADSVFGSSTPWTGEKRTAAQRDARPSRQTRSRANS